MVYRVLLYDGNSTDGIDIYDPAHAGLVLYNAIAKPEVGAAGSFDFTMPPEHVFYDKIIPLGSSIEVLEDGESIFFGRPLIPTIGFYNQKVYHCEGALAFLNDSRYPSRFALDLTYNVREYFRFLIGEHNDQHYLETNRRFTIGTVDVGSEDIQIYREVGPEQTIMELVRRGCIGTDGGYLFTRRESGVTYIDWVKEMPYTCNQDVTFGLNLLDMKRSGNTDFYTAVLVEGKDVSTFQVNADDEIREKYGTIVGYLKCDDLNVHQLLENKATEFLYSQQFDAMIFEITAAEQHYLNVNLDAFKAGQMVHMISNPHFVDLSLPCWSVEYNLNSGEKKVVLGTKPKQTLTAITRKTDDIEDAVLEVEDDIAELNADVENIIPEVQDLVNNQGVVTGDDGNQYAIGVDTNGDPYATKIPSSLYISQLPLKTTYALNDNCDWTGLVITAEYGDGTTEDVTQNFTVVPASGTTVGETKGNFTATATWTTAGGKLYEVYFDYKVGYLPSGNIIIDGVEYDMDEWDGLIFSNMGGFAFVNYDNTYTFTRVDAYPTPGVPEEIISRFKAVGIQTSPDSDTYEVVFGISSGDEYEYFRNLNIYAEVNGEERSIISIGTAGHPYTKKHTVTYNGETKEIYAFIGIYQLSGNSSEYAYGSYPACMIAYLAFGI